MKRVYPLEELDRLSERIWADAQGNIIDRDSFDDAFEDYIGEGAKVTEKQLTLLRPKVFKRIVANHPEISRGRLFRKAKGKDFARDKAKKARVVVTDKKEYVKRTAPRVDLKDYDMPVKRRKPQFNVLGRVGGRVVYARRTFVIVSGKRRLRYRDSKGRFVSVKRKT